MNDTVNMRRSLLSLYYDAQIYGWDILTIKTIEAGIKYAYADVVANSNAFYEGYQRLFQVRFTHFGLKLIYRLKPDISHWGNI